MKNQNDLIFSIVAVVVALGAILAIFFTRPSAQDLPAPTPVPLEKVEPAAGAVVYSNSLPAGSNNGGFGSPGGGGGFGEGIGTPGGAPAGLGRPGGAPAGLGRPGGPPGGGPGGLSAASAPTGATR